MTFSSSLKLLFRERRQATVRLLFSSVLLAVLSVSTITTVSDQLKQLMLNSSSRFIAGDRQLIAPREIETSWLDYARSLNLQVAKSVEFSSMLMANEQFQLVSVKAVDSLYPLKGDLLVEGEVNGKEKGEGQGEEKGEVNAELKGESVLPAGEDTLESQDITQAVQRYSKQSGPERGKAWLHSRLFPLLDVSPGSSISLGDAQLQVEYKLLQEPDVSFQMMGLSPRVLIHADQVAETNLLQPGSRANWRYYFAGPEESLQQFDAWLEPRLEPSQRWQGVKEGRPAIANALDKTEVYLLLGSSLSVLLACIAIAIAARQFALEQIDQVALLKTLGKKGKEVVQMYVSQVVVIALGAGLLGVLLSLGLSNIILMFIAEWVDELTYEGVLNINVSALWLSLTTALVAVLGFALPQFIQLSRVTPMTILRETKRKAEAWSSGSSIAAIITVFGLLYLYGQNILLVGMLVLALCLVIAMIVFVAYLIYQISHRHMGEGVPLKSPGKYALFSLFKRKTHSLIQFSVFGLAILLFALILLARESLVNDWETQLPEDAPNHFLINIAEYDLERIESLLDSKQVSTSGLYPMVRGRLSHINDIEVKVAVTKDVGALNRELNLTWAAELPEDNELLAGEWWSESKLQNQGGDTVDTVNTFYSDDALDSFDSGDAYAAPLAGVSIESELAEKIGVSLNDRLRFSIGGSEINAKVTSIRSVQWDSMRPNFYMIFEPGSLKNFPSTYITSFYLANNQKSVLNDITRTFPTISILELDQLVDKIKGIVKQVSSMVELVLVFIFCAALLVMSALISASTYERLREAALLRTLGANKRLITRSQLFEFGFIALSASFVAIIGAEIAMWLMQYRLFEGTFQVHIWLWFILPLVAVVLIAGLSYVQIRHVPKTSPMLILRNRI